MTTAAEYYTWTEADEKRFVDYFCTSRERTRQYIKTHYRSPHEHHQVGVDYAKGLLRRRV